LKRKANPKASINKGGRKLRVLRVIRRKELGLRERRG